MSNRNRSINLVVFIIVSMAFIFGYGKLSPGPSETIIPD